MSAARGCREVREAFDLVKSLSEEAGMSCFLKRARKHFIVEVKGRRLGKTIALSGSPRTDNYLNYTRQKANAAIKAIKQEEGS